MKVLSLDQMYFLLPDDFNGNFNDALRELIRYRESLPNPKPFPPIVTLNNVERKSDWQLFLDAIKDGYKLYGSCFVGEWDKNKEEWVRLNDKINNKANDPQ